MNPRRGLDMRAGWCSWLLLCAAASAGLAQAPALGPEAIPVAPTPAAATPEALPAACRATLAELESLAIAGNPTIVAAEALVRQEQGLWKQVGLYPNPQVGYVRSDPDQPGQSETQGVFLSQEFVTAGKLRLNRAV